MISRFKSNRGEAVHFYIQHKMMDKISTGNWFTIYFVKLHLTQKFAFSSISSLLMYYILINVLYLNFCIISQLKCSICKLFDETPQHLFLWTHLYTTFMEPSSIIHFRKNYITSFNSTECHLWIRWCFRSELSFSKSFSSNFPIQCA